MDLTKTCVVCKEEKPVSQFRRTTRKGEISYYNSLCKLCRKKNRIDRLYKNAPSSKVCLRCCQLLDIGNFNKHLASKDGYASWCKRCRKEYHKEYNSSMRTAPKKDLEGKVCPGCKEYKDIEEFSLCATNKDGRSRRCRQCMHDNYIKNKKDRMKKSVARARNRRYKDPTYRMIGNLRKRVLDGVIKGCKSAKTLELLGCTGEECMNYLETLFWPGMTRENYGYYGWVIDHIIPVDAFDKTDPNWQFKCFNYKNLQPLWRPDNDRKKSRLDWTPAESKYELPERLKGVIPDQRLL